MLSRNEVAATHHRQLKAWCLADGLRRRFVSLTSRDLIRRDFNFCDQTSRACRSACRNLAEGFWKFSHAEFARYVNIAQGSLGELLDTTDEALEREYITREEYEVLNREIHSALRASRALHQYLVSTPTPRPKERRAQEKTR